MTSAALTDNNLGKSTVYLVPAVKAVIVYASTDVSPGHDHLLRIYFPEGQRDLSHTVMACPARRSAPEGFALQPPIAGDTRPIPRGKI
jgi:hypothetical protein